MAQFSVEQIPRPVLILGVFAIGVFLFTQFKKPHTICDTQLEQFRETESGRIFNRRSKSIDHAATITRAKETCYEGRGSGGACFEYYRLLRMLVINLENVSAECGDDLMEIGELKLAIGDGVTVMAQVAWGDEPPDRNAPFGPLQAPELALFCQLRQVLFKYGQEGEWSRLRSVIFAKLPGEPRKFETNPEGQNRCTNCENLPSALQALGSVEEVTSRSLFGLRCDNLL